MTSLPVASPRAWTMRSWPWPPSRPRARRPPAGRTACPSRSVRRSAAGPRGPPARPPPRSHSEPPASSVSATWSSKRSSGIEHAGDAALGVVAVRLLDRLLGDDQDRELRIDGQRRPQPGQSAADDQHVGEEVRHALGMKRNEISRNGRGHVSFTINHYCRPIRIGLVANLRLDARPGSPPRPVRRPPPRRRRRGPRSQLEAARLARRQHGHAALLPSRTISGSGKLMAGSRPVT